MLLTRLGLHAHLQLAEDAHNLERHSHLQYTLFELTVIRSVARAAGEPYASSVATWLDELGANDVIDQLLADLESPPWWQGLELEELVDRAIVDLGHPPFSDGGERRSVSWHALGVQWRVEFENEYEPTLVGERLAAFAQLVAVELATSDPVLLPTKVTFYVDAREAHEQVDLASDSDGHGTTWRVGLPKAAGGGVAAVGKVATDTLTVVMSAIANVSVLSRADLDELFEAAAKDGLLTRLVFGTVHDVAYREQIDVHEFAAARPRLLPPLTGSGVAARTLEADQLHPTAPGRYYSESRAKDLAAGRYTNIQKALVATLPALRGHEPFARVVTALRATGWKDWHILLGVFNVAQNHRVQVARGPRNEAEARALYERFTTPEHPGRPAPLRLFTEEALRDVLRVTWPSTLKGWGLTANQNPIDVDALEALLARRYGYWDDDVEHDEIW